MSFLVLLPFLLTALPSVPPRTLAPAEFAQAREEADLKKLRVWIQRARRGRDGLDEEQRSALRALLGDLERLRADEPSLTGDIDTALLDLAALRRMPSSRKSAEGFEATQRVARFGEEALRRRIESDGARFCDWLAQEVLGSSHADGDARLVAARLLEGLHLVSTREALLRTARTETAELGEAAVAALVGWNDPAVHEFFLDRLEASGAGLSDLAQHLERTRDQLPPVTRARVRVMVERLYLSEDWRDAARGRVLLPAVETRRAVPILMEALAVWGHRTEEGRGSRRILGEIVRELQRLSGRAIGPQPERWTRWWNAVLEGRVELPETIEEGGGFVSAASFFGLSVMTDRVVFLIDRSGSMESTFGTDGRTRFEEAVTQFLRFLEQAGTRTQFSLALFSDRGELWQSGLSPATSANLEQAKRWLDRQAPEGGTQLFEGLRAALRLDREGHLAASRLDADTVIVLCDGATAEGPEWVAPWMRRENEQAQLVFHCVQIGRTGKGTLEALAAATGGDFVLVD